MSEALPDDEVLERVFGVIERALEAGEAVDVVGLARAEGLAVEVVEDCLAGAAALREDGDEPPARLGQYQLLEPIGDGGMGEVWRARDLRLGREVAIKLLRAGARADQVERFRREGVAAGGLDHPNLVKVHASGWEGERAFLVMELVPGARTLDAVWPGLGWRERARMVLEAAQGVGCAHRAGVLHRDLKPSNLLVDAAGRVRVVDFGLAREESADALTRTGAVMGTSGYLAPEQAEGRPDAQGPATDVWGLGVVLYQALSGRLPFPAASFMAYCGALARGEPAPPLHAEDPAAPEALGVVCRKALELDPGRRYADADAFAQDLERVLAGEPPRVRAGAGRWLALAGFGLVGVALLAVFGSRPGREEPVAPSPRPSPTATQAATPPAAPRVPWSSVLAVEEPGRLARAWQWLHANPNDPDARRARAYLKREAPKRPLWRVDHPLGNVRVRLWGTGGLLTFGRGGARCWAPLGAAVGVWQRGRRGVIASVDQLPGGLWVAATGRHVLASRRFFSTPKGGWDLTVLRHNVTPLAVSPSGARLACLLRDGSIRLIDATRGVLGARVPAGRSQGGCRFAFLDEDRLVVARWDPQTRQGELSVWDRKRGATVSSTPMDQVLDLAVARGGAWVALSLAKGGVVLLGKGLRVKTRLGSPSWRGRCSLGFSREGQTLLVAPGRLVAPERRALHAFDVAGGEGRAVSRVLGYPPSALAVGGDLVAVGEPQRGAEVWLWRVP